MKTLLVDASYLYKRSITGAKNIYSNGKNIGGLYTFYTTLRKIIELLNIEKVVLCWDGENSGKGRYLIYNEYKANRKSKSWYNQITLTDKQIAREEKSPDSDLWQKVRIQQYAEELFFRQMMVDEIEGDDLIAHYCHNKPEEEDVIIYTNDRDFLQLLDIINVSIYFNNLNAVVDSSNFEIYFSYHYRNALAIKILCGDVSDNVKGVEGLGEDSLLKYFPELKNGHVLVNDILNKSKIINEERISKKLKPLKVLETILSSKKILIRNKKIMDLYKPFINEEVVELYHDLYTPLDPNDRGSKNLIKYMNDDGFLQHFYENDFVNFVKPFYSVITSEIYFYKNNGIKKRRGKTKSILS